RLPAGRSASDRLLMSQRWKFIRVERYGRNLARCFFEQMRPLLLGGRHRNWMIRRAVGGLKGG
ncbi:MAG: hypothetical protein ACKN94_10155, partial [Pirellulaceae bacterium]